MKEILYYVSSHGFGHAVRAGRVIKALVNIHGARVTVRTAAPEWIFTNLGLGGQVRVEYADADPGLIQKDSMSMDMGATLASLESRFKRMEEAVSQERRVIEKSKPHTVVCDIAPLGVLAGVAAGLPTAVVANFLWDWILRGYSKEAPAMEGYAGRFQEIYKKASVILRTGLSGGMDGYPNIRDVPLITKKVKVSREEARERLGLGPGPVALVSLGGFGLEGFFAELDKRVTMMDTLVPSDQEGRKGRVIFLDRKVCDYYDLLAASDIVAGKMGYGLCSELIANKRGLLYTPRADFVESRALERETARYIACLEAKKDEFMEGALDGMLSKLLETPHPEGFPEMDEGESAAKIIMDMAQ